MASVNAINSQVSFGRRIRTGEDSKKVSHKVIDKVYDKYINTINDKYDIDYANESPARRKMANQDFLAEKAFCIGAGMLAFMLFLTKGRNVFNGIAPAVETTGKKLLNKGASTLDSNHKPAQGIGSWTADRLKRTVFAAKINGENKIINNAVGDIIRRAEKDGSLEITEKLIRQLEEISVNGRKIGNKELAAALNKNLGETMDIADVDKLVSKHQARLFGNSVVYGEVDKNSRLHKLLSKIFKNEEQLQNIENKLGNGFGIKNGNEAAEAVIAGGTAIGAGANAYDKADYFTDMNDDAIGGFISEEDQGKIRDFQDTARAAKNGHRRIGADDLGAMAQVLGSVFGLGA